MASAAQLKAKANFKKAIAYRKKHGCSLKEAFSAIYPKKKAAVKKEAKKKVGKIAKKTVPKKTAKKVSSHKDTKSHNVNIRVVSGVDFKDVCIQARNRCENLLEKYSNELNKLLEERKKEKNQAQKNKINHRIDVLRYYNRIIRASIKKNNDLILKHK